jgi:hypothetical protein
MTRSKPESGRGAYKEVEKYFNWRWQQGECHCPLYGTPYSMRDRLPVQSNYPSDCLLPQGALRIYNKESC